MKSLKYLIVLMILFVGLFFYLIQTTNTKDLVCAGFAGIKCPWLFSCNVPKSNWSDEQGKCVFLNIINLESQYKPNKPIILPTPAYNPNPDYYATPEPTRASTETSIEPSARKKYWLVLKTVDSYGLNYSIEYPTEWEIYRKEDRFSIPCKDNPSEMCVELRLGIGGSGRDILGKVTSISRNGFSFRYQVYIYNDRNYWVLMGGKNYKTKNISEGSFLIDGQGRDLENYPTFIPTLTEMVGTFKVLDQ